MDIDLPTGSAQESGDEQAAGPSWNTEAASHDLASSER
jgi:hypothetical protein